MDDFESGEQLHPSVENALRWLTELDHLPGHLRRVAEPFGTLGRDMAVILSGPEVGAGMRKLLEAKDCFVRAAVALMGNRVTGAYMKENPAP